MRIHAWLGKYTSLSRRDAEKKVEEGSVTIDGKTAVIGQKVQGHEVIRVDLKRISSVTTEDILLALNKPEGYECSRKPQGTDLSVYDLLPNIKVGKWILIGRLDINTSGLLLVTNNGALANKLAHPSNGYEREYLVRINGELTHGEITDLKKGVMLEDGIAKCHRITEHRGTKGVNRWYKIVMKEGRNRIVRRLMEIIGLKVSRLIRVRFGPIKLEKALGVGSYQAVDSKIFE